MPAPVIGAMTTYIANQLNVTVWDGEVPRYDTNGNAINSDTVSTPSSWPVISLEMSESGFERSWTTEDAYIDKGDLTVRMWDTTRLGAETLMGTIETLLVKASNWEDIDMGGPSINPYYFVQLLLNNWYSGQEKGIRTNKSQLLYRCDLVFEAEINGVISTE